MKQARKLFITGIIIILAGLFASCDSAQDSNEPARSEQTSPEVTWVSADVTDTDVILKWTEPAAQDVDHIEVTCTGDSSLDQTVERGMCRCTISGLADGVAYIFRLRCVFANGRASDGIDAAVTCGEYDEARTIYFIHTVEELDAVRGGAAGHEDRDLDKHYKLMADLDLSVCSDGEGWEPIGTNPPWSPVGEEIGSFNGTFNGMGHVVRNLTISGEPTSVHKYYSGLFGGIGSKGVVENLKLESCKIENLSLFYAGNLAGVNYGAIKNCSAEGSVTAYASIGGLAGINHGTITGCTAEGSVSGLENVGGLVGYNYGTITGVSSALCRVVSTGSSIGGLVGHNTGSVSVSYAGGSVLVDGSENVKRVGGLVGFNQGDIKGCLASGDVNNNLGNTGGLVGFNSGSISSCAVGFFSNSEMLADIVNEIPDCPVQYLIEGASTGSPAPGVIERTTITGSGGSTGGLVGLNNTVNIIYNCAVSAEIIGENYTGGMVGNCLVRYTLDNCHSFEVQVAGGDSTGGLAGSFRGYIKDCSVSGEVTGTQNVGGLVGNYWYISIEMTDPPTEQPSIQNSSSSADVTGELNTGGLLGNGGNGVRYCTASGNVTGVDNTGGLIGYSDGNGPWYCSASGDVSGVRRTGGLAGYADQYIQWCFATGCVTGEEETGGLVGYTESAVYLSYATGEVTGGIYTGGLAGNALYSPDSTFGNVIGYCYSRGNVTGADYTGGLVGYLENGRCDDSYATGMVTGDTSTGGLIGSSSGTLSECFYCQLPDNSIGTFVDDVALMTDEALYINAGWDFAGETDNGTFDRWSISPGRNDGFPYLTGLSPE